MPTYAYECAACGHKLEEFQSMTAAPLEKCPACKKAKLQRLIGAGAGVIFKGTGFYQTDYKKSGGGDAKTKKGEGSGKSDASPTEGQKTDGPAPTTDSGSSKTADKSQSKTADKPSGDSSAADPKASKSASKRR